MLFDGNIAGPRLCDGLSLWEELKRTRFGDAEHILGNSPPVSLAFYLITFLFFFLLLLGTALEWLALDASSSWTPWPRGSSRRRGWTCTARGTTWSRRRSRLVLLEAVTCGNTQVPARNLWSYIYRLVQMEPGDSVTRMELEFKVSTARKSRRHHFMHRTAHHKGEFPVSPASPRSPVRNQGCLRGSFEVGTIILGIKVALDVSCFFWGGNVFSKCIFKIQDQEQTFHLQ